MKPRGTSETQGHQGSQTCQGAGEATDHQGGHDLTQGHPGSQTCQGAGEATDHQGGHDLAGPESISSRMERGEGGGGSLPWRFTLPTASLP